jgi:hypothetical protein
MSPNTGLNSSKTIGFLIGIFRIMLEWVLSQTSSSKTMLVYSSSNKMMFVHKIANEIVSLSVLVGRRCLIVTEPT